ncbi:MAG: hypothetical protein HZA50_06325 [Planctomycetes bacterium]|nr:hypothetical protein [Planctomycetota bacterium]
MENLHLHLAVVLLASLCCVALGYEGPRADSVSLNGQWEFVEGGGDEAAETPEGAAKLQWQATTLPGNFVPWNEKAATDLKFIWTKRTFKVSQEQAGKLAVLKWNRISFGAAAYINGKKVGENAPTGPYQVVLPKGALAAGENTIVLKIPGAAGVAKGKSGHFLIPAGFAGQNPKGMPGVGDDIWLDFSDSIYIKWALALPDLAASKVRVRVTPTGPDALDDLTIAVQVKSWPDGKEIGKNQAAANFKPDSDPLGGEHATVEVPMPDFKPWTHEDCNLYSATVQIVRGGKTLDEVSFRFGMREIKVADRRFKLNGKNLFLRGSELVGDWGWGDIFKGKEKTYLVTEAREMSMNSFRTHTQPPNRLWTDICDENGTMLLAEFPLLYNMVDHKLTPEEMEIYKKNALTDAAGWMGRLWNHPSVIMWVLSNESLAQSDLGWETGMYQDFVLKLDPTRPTMRAGGNGPTKFNNDLHDCSNIRNPSELESLSRYVQWFKKTQAIPDVTCTNTEYMNILPRSPTLWTGNEDKEADAMVYGQLGMEHTEAMRRLRYDGIWPYMYAGWTKTRTGKEWKAGFAKPISAALYSALSPVLASLDLTNANYLPSQEVETDLWLINDSWHDAKLHVDVLLTKESPEFIPEAKCFESAVSEWKFDFDLKSDSITKVPVKWKLPDKPGNYWLTARTTATTAAPPASWPTRPVLSQRFVRAIKTPEAAEAAKKRTVVLLGGNDAAKEYFKTKGLKFTEEPAGLKPDEHVVVIWNAAALGEQEKQSAKALCDFAAGGGRIAVLGAGSWKWNELCDVKVETLRGSRVFVYEEGAKHPLLSGIDPQWLVRWNGLPGTVSTGCLKGPAMDKARKILWAVEPASTVAAEVPAAAGDGKVLFLLLAIPTHLDIAKPNYDPVAENILLNVLEGKSLSE